MMASSNRLSQVNEMLELSQKRTAGNGGTRGGAESRQSRNLLIAFVLLMTALVAVLFTDRQFWFGADHSTIEADSEPVAAPVTPANSGAVLASSPVASVHAKKQPVVAHVLANTPASTQEPAAAAPVVTGSRVVLPPLDVEVIAGDNHKVVRPGVNAATITVTNSNRTNSTPLTAASLRSPQASYSATYPLLAEHMNVQGSVVLQAVINADGVVQNLRVLSGPSILASAAQQAVREWKFKPVLQNGQAVETKATITVNFTIKVADNTPKIS